MNWCDCIQSRLLTEMISYFSERKLLIHLINFPLHTISQVHLNMFDQMFFKRQRILQLLDYFY